jgi:hypothetical protein
VDVEDVQLLLLRHTRHLGAQGHRVRWILEERVLEDVDEVNVDVLLVYPLDGEWALVRDEVDLVAPLGELYAEARGEYATPADARVTGYADPRVWCPLTDRVSRRVK